MPTPIVVRCGSHLVRLDLDPPVVERLDGRATSSSDRLSVKAAALLGALGQSSPDWVPIVELKRRVWSDLVHVDARVVHTTLYRLRSWLRRIGADHVGIASRRGSYRLVVDDRGVFELRQVKAPGQVSALSPEAAMPILELALQTAYQWHPFPTFVTTPEADIAGMRVLWGNEVFFHFLGRDTGASLGLGEVAQLFSAMLTDEALARFVEEQGQVREMALRNPDQDVFILGPLALRELRSPFHPETVRPALEVTIVARYLRVEGRRSLSIATWHVLPLDSWLQWLMSSGSRFRAAWGVPRGRAIGKPSS